MEAYTRQDWLQERRENIIAKFVVFLISPVLGMFAALVRPNTKTSFIILLLSLITLGLAINIPAERTEDVNFDSITYRAQFENYREASSQDFKSILLSYTQMGEDSATDIYSRTIYFVVSRFTNNYHVCFALVAAIFAFFMLKSLRYLVSEPNFEFSLLCVVLLFLFTLCQIEKINAFRFYTAFWIALYALFKILLEKNKRYWLLLVITPAVHGSFFVIFVIYALYILMRNRQKTAVFIVLAGLLFSAFAVQAFSWMILHLPESLGGHYGQYLNQWYMMRINEGGIGYKWVVRLMELAVRLSINAVALFFAFNYNKYIKETKIQNLYFFLLAVTAFVNFTFMIPDVGSRYVMFVFPLIAYIWLVCFAPIKRWNWFICAFASLFLFYFLVLPWNIYQVPCLRFYMALWDADVLYQSPIYLWIKYIFFPPA